MVNQHQYLRFHEVSRGRRPDGRPRYEATVYIESLQPLAEYGIVWLADFGGLPAQSIGLATKLGNQLPFVFTNPDGSFIANDNDLQSGDEGWTWTFARGSRRQAFPVRGVDADAGRGRTPIIHRVPILPADRHLATATAREPPRILSNYPRATSARYRGFRRTVDGQIRFPEPCVQVRIGPDQCPSAHKPALLRSSAQGYFRVVPSSPFRPRPMAAAARN